MCGCQTGCCSDSLPNDLAKEFFFPLNLASGSCITPSGLYNNDRLTGHDLLHGAFTVDESIKPLTVKFVTDLCHLSCFSFVIFPFASVNGLTLDVLLIPGSAGVTANINVRRKNKKA